MLHGDSVRAAADEIVAAALLAEGWKEALTKFARAADARDVVLMRNARNRMITAITTEEVAPAVAEYAAGHSPPNSRYLRVAIHGQNAFRVDHDDYSSEELARDPFYQEFLRPNGIFWHANAILAPGRDEYVELSLKRRFGIEPYTRADAVVLDRVLPELHAAARIAKATLDAETRGMRWLLRRRGELFFEIDSHGRVLPGQSPGELDPSSPLRVFGRRLAATDREAQALLDRAVAKAVSRPGRTALAPLTGPDGRSYLLQVHPVPGVARDVFLAAQAIAVLIERNGSSVARLDIAAIRDAFGLTSREADVVRLLAEGFDLAAIAAHLGIRIDTARTYLKDVFEKTGTRRQGELVALVARSAP